MKMKTRFKMTMINGTEKWAKPLNTDVNIYNYVNLVSRVIDVILSNETVISVQPIAYILDDDGKTIRRMNTMSSFGLHDLYKDNGKVYSYKRLEVE